MSLHACKPPAFGHLEAEVRHTASLQFRLDARVDVDHDSTIELQDILPFFEQSQRPVDESCHLAASHRLVWAVTRAVASQGDARGAQCVDGAGVDAVPVDIGECCRLLGDVEVESTLQKGRHLGSGDHRVGAVAQRPGHAASGNTQISEALDMPRFEGVPTVHLHIGETRGLDRLRLMPGQGPAEPHCHHGPGDAFRRANPGRGTGGAGEDAALPQSIDCGFVDAALIVQDPSSKLVIVGHDFKVHTCVATFFQSHRSLRRDEIIRMDRVSASREAAELEVSRWVAIGVATRPRQLNTWICQAWMCQDSA